MTGKTIKIGTRGSPLALRQTRTAISVLAAKHSDIIFEEAIIKTSGDWKPADGESYLNEAQGGKGLFIKEIEQALIDGRIDAAVHSMKDVPSFLPEGVGVDHVMEREDPRDALIYKGGLSFEDLPQGAVVGTCSLRRQALLLSLRQDLTIVPLRGNVQTRLDKLASGQVDATLLAMAGLNRLDIVGDFIHPFAVEVMLPSCGQGIVAIETRSDDMETRIVMDAVHHEDTAFCAAAERGALQALNGSCHTPIGAHAVREGEHISLAIKVASLDGKQVWEDHARQKVTTMEEAHAFGFDLAAALKPAIPEEILNQ